MGIGLAAPQDTGAEKPRPEHDHSSRFREVAHVRGDDSDEQRCIGKRSDPRNGGSKKPKSTRNDSDSHQGLRVRGG
jgi:hypothetical protein